MAKKKKRPLTAWQKHVKSYMASHPGLSFKEALPKAKLTYKKGKSPSPSASKKPRKVKRKMAKKKKRRSRSMTIPLAPIAGLAAGLALPAQRAMEGRYTGPDSALAWLTYSYTGIGSDGRFNIEGLKTGLLPLVIGCLVHKFVGGAPLNLNRILGAAKVPFIRI